VDVAASIHTSPVEVQDSDEDLGTLSQGPAPASILSQVERKQNPPDEPRASIASATHEELQLKQQVAKRIEKEEALVLEQKLELEKIKREAEEKIKHLNETIRTRKSKLEVLKDLLDD